MDGPSMSPHEEMNHALPAAPAEANEGPNPMSTLTLWQRAERHMSWMGISACHGVKERINERERGELVINRLRAS